MSLSVAQHAAVGSVPSVRGIRELACLYSAPLPPRSLSAGFTDLTTSINRWREQRRAWPLHRGRAAQWDRLGSNRPGRGFPPNGPTDTPSGRPSVRTERLHSVNVIQTRAPGPQEQKHPQSITCAETNPPQCLCERSPGSADHSTLPAVAL